MRTTKKITFLILVCSFLLFSGLQGSDRSGNSKSGDSGKNFDTRNKKTISGTVESVTKVEDGRYQSPGLHLRIRARKGKGIYNISMGPDYLFSNDRMTLSKGDNIIVNSFVGTENGKYKILCFKCI